MNKKYFIAPALAAVLALGAVDFAHANPVEDFYKSNDIILYVGSNPGGGYDTYARLFGRHFGNHIPGQPRVGIRNMPGAGSLTMTNHVANLAPKDGSALGAPQNTVPLERLLHILSPGGANAQFDARALNWIGSPSQDVFLLIAWHTAKAQTFEDLKTMEMTVGSSGHNTDHSITARLLNNIFGTRLNIVTGYGSAGEILMALERGEVEGNSGRAYSSLMSVWGDRVREGQVRILLQMGIAPHPDLPNVPFALDIAPSDGDRQILELMFSKYQMSRPFFAPEGVPQERVAALRAAFNDTMKDPAFLKDAETQRVDIDPATGEEVQALIDRLYQTPEDVLVKARAILAPPR